MTGWAKKVNEFFKLKKEDLQDKNGNPKFPWITYEEYKTDYLCPEIIETMEEEYSIETLEWRYQELYIHTLQRTRMHFKKLFPDFKISTDSDEIFKCQSIEPVHRPIEYRHDIIIKS